MTQPPAQNRGADPQAVEPEPADETAEQARTRRMNALRQLAGTSPQLPVVQPGSAAGAAGGAAAGARQAVRRPWWLAGVALLLAVAVVAGVFLTGHLTLPLPSGGHSATAAAPLKIAPVTASLVCPQDVAWSPDGTRVAVLGYRDACFDPQAFFATNQEPAGLLIIYNANTGKQLKSIPLDPPIVAAFPINQSVSDTFARYNLAPNLHLVINYSHVVWLPDGKHLAVQFQTYRPTTVPDFQFFFRQFEIAGDAINGIWQGDQDGSDVHLTTHVDANTQITALGQPLPGVAGWDLSAGSAAPVVPVVPGASAGTLPLALGYAWQPGGTVAPQSPFDDASLPASVPAGPVGRAGDATFTFWQPGTLTVHVLAPLGEHQLPNGYVLDTTFAALSPDGRSLTAPLEVSGLLEPDGQPPNAQIVANDHLDGLPRLPIRDAALRAVLDALTRASADGHNHSAALAWSPNGRYLAAQVAPATPGVAPSQYPVTIYDTRSGQLLATLTPLANGGNANQQLITDLRWSPDSTHLLLANTLLNAYTIWGPDQLPQVG